MKQIPSSINRLIQTEDIQGLSKSLSGLPGFEIANIIADKSVADQTLVLTALPSKLAVETFDYLSTRSQKKLLRSLPTTQTACMLMEMTPDDRTALLEELPRTVLDEYLKLLSPQERDLSLKLLSYPEDSVGRMMTTDYIAVKKSWTVERVLDHIKDYGHDSETINFIYVIDDDNILIDDVKIKEFLFVPQNYKVAQICDGKFISLLVTEKAETAIETFKTHGRGALPVVDDHGKLLGIVTIDDVLRLASQVATEDLQKVGAVETFDRPYFEMPFFDLMKKRGRWLVVLFIGELFTASAMTVFENEIARAVVLALFLPLIISSGGNAGSQSSTLIIRAMSLGEVKLSDWWRVMRREVLSGIFLGGLLGSIGFFRVILWGSIWGLYGPHWILLGWTVAFTLLGVVLWGVFAGSMLPIVLRRLGADPAVASAPLVATLIDVTGIVIYFVTALLILKGTLL
jgi:magnesium transporter